MEYNVEKNNKLNERQWALYTYLKNKNGSYTKQKQICLDMMDRYVEYSNFDIDNFHDSPARLLLTSDIRTINYSGDPHLVILSTSSGIAVACESSYEEMLNKEYQSLVARLVRFSKKAAKLKKNGQYRLFSNGINHIESLLKEV